MEIMHLFKSIKVRNFNMHFPSISTRRCFSKEKEFVPFWSTSEDFEEILISSLMWSDHMPDFVLKVLQDTLLRLDIRSDKGSEYYPPCRSPHHGLQRCLSDNASCYISVLDSPTGKDCAICLGLY